MTDAEIIKKINKCLDMVHAHFDTADKKARESVPAEYKTQQHGIRKWWLDEYRTQTGRRVNMFSFNADEILQMQIPSYVVGCSGRADVFAKYAVEQGLDVYVVPMVDTHSKKEHPDGHQIIAVRFSDGLHLIDPGGGRTNYERAKIEGDCQIGNSIYYNRTDGRAEYKITAILSPAEHAKIDSIEKLSAVYKYSDKQIQGKGAHSIVYTDPENPEYVIKENKHVSDDPNYIKRQQAGFKIIDDIRATGLDVGVVLPELISVSQTPESQTIKERRIHGKTFDQDGQRWQSLTMEQQQSVIQQMAQFLVAMHSTGQCRPASSSIRSMFDGSRLKNSADDIINAYDGAMPPEMANALHRAQEYLDASDNSDEVHVLTHGDLRVNNLMFDDKTGRLAVLDFELAKPNNVYRDFVAYASSSLMPWDYTSRLIKAYNAIPNKKYQIQINPTKVQQMMLYAIMHEFARNVRPGDNERISEQEKRKYFNWLQMRIKTITGIDVATIDKQTAFTNASKDVKQRATTGARPVPQNDDR